MASLRGVVIRNSSNHWMGILYSWERKCKGGGGGEDAGGKGDWMEIDTLGYAQEGCYGRVKVLNDSSKGGLI